MFAGVSFRGAKACSPSAICAGSEVLDFARIRASAPDIDVVGFYHPYCDMQGLRWCRRITQHYDDLSEFDRWRCALWRRTGWAGGSLSAQACGNVDGLVWENVRRAVIATMRQAPTLQSGGVLYVHVPLPHPPGEAGGQTLRADYEANLVRAAQLLGELITTVDKAGLTPRIVLFSDHPLRQVYWCKEAVQYAGAGCVMDASLRDAEVPVIVAARRGTPLPSLENIESNAQVFSLIGAW
jgi:hypothetical protein